MFAIILLPLVFVAPAPLSTSAASICSDTVGRRAIAIMGYKAIWNGAVVAESDVTIEVEGNQYFPPDTIKKEMFTPSLKKTFCGWKGEASYYNIVAGGDENYDAAWFYAAPKDAAKNIAGYVAFWKGVKVTTR